MSIFEGFNDLGAEVNIQDEILFQETDGLFEKDGLQTRFLEVIVRFFQENVKFEKVIELSGCVECKIDDSTKIRLEIPRLLAQVLESTNATGNDTEKVHDDFLEVEEVFDDADVQLALRLEQGIQSDMSDSLMKEVSSTLAQLRNNPRRYGRNSNVKNRFQCNMCNFCSSRNLKLVEHVNAVHKKICRFKCDLCDFSCSRQLSLRRHRMRIHERLRPYKCELCPYTAAASGDVQKHIASVHNKEYKYKCKFCSYTSTQPGNLRIHTQSVHEKKRNYKCDFCEYTSYLSTSVRRHITTVHVNKQKLECDKCDFKTWIPKKMKMHNLEVHDKKDVHLCNFCDFKCLQRGNLKNHMSLMHDKKCYNCTDCDFKGTDARVFREHLFNVHQNTEFHKFACPLCEFRGQSATLFKQHSMSMHSNDRPFKCFKCDVTCKTVTELDQHGLNEHGARMSNTKVMTCDECNFTCTDLPSLKSHVLSAHVFKVTVAVGCQLV